jgi:UDP-N-acetylmuramoylalanine--D-glutamate ligase
MSDPPPIKTRPPIPSGPFLVVGLARSGVAAAQMLIARGEEVIGVDSGRPAGVERLAALGVEVSLDGQGIEHLERVRTVVKSPGVPRDAPVIEAAGRRQVPVIGELELAWRAIPNRFVGVTGTNGKTTTTELLGHLYRTAGVPAAVAGNVGTPLSSLAGDVDADVTVVCECSSFQLEDTEAFAPECAVMLNIAPDHLDRHGTMGDYLASKLRIFANQANEDVAVYNGDDPGLAGLDIGGCGRRVRFCVTAEGGCAVSLSGGTVFAGGEPLIEADELRLIGTHNVENAMAAAGAALAMGLERDAVGDGLRSFAGVSHRLERVAEIGGVTYVNDSKATNVDAATMALRSFDGGVHVILGGSLKGSDFDALAGPVAERCRAAFLIGEAAEVLERALAPAREAGVRVELCEGLEDAVRRAAALAAPGEVVLLSPASASFDSFRDFEQRGERFREIVEGMR